MCGLTSLFKNVLCTYYIWQKYSGLQQYLAKLQRDREWVMYSCFHVLQTLRNEIDNHEPRIISIWEIGNQLINEGHPQSEEFAQKLEQLQQSWEELRNAVDDRERALRENERAQRVHG